jgi:hypothetical protein
LNKRGNIGREFEIRDFSIDRNVSGTRIGEAARWDGYVSKRLKNNASVPDFKISWFYGFQAAAISRCAKQKTIAPAMPYFFLFILIAFQFKIETIC